MKAYLGGKTYWTTTQAYRSTLLLVNIKNQSWISMLEFKATTCFPRVLCIDYCPTDLFHGRKNEWSFAVKYGETTCNPVQFHSAFSVRLCFHATLILNLIECCHLCAISLQGLRLKKKSFSWWSKGTCWQFLLEIKYASLTSMPTCYLIRLIVKVEVKATKMIFYC